MAGFFVMSAWWFGQPNLIAVFEHAPVALGGERFATMVEGAG
jgi:hypothetical protein